jgi:hypothetical protein
VVFIFLFVLVVYIGFQNRNLESLRSKVIPAIAIAVVGALFTIWFSLESKKIELKFTSTVFFHKSDKNPLDAHYQNSHKFGGHQFDIELLNFIANYMGQDQELSKAVFGKDEDKIKEFYHNMVFIKLLARFFWMYADWWDIGINSVRRGNAVETEVSAIEPKLPCSTLEWKDFLETINAEGDFHQLLSNYSKDCFIKKMTVPPETKVGFVTSKYGKTLVLTNPFVRVYITINRHSGSIGLGDYQWLLNYDNKQNEEFWSEHFEVSCKAEFEKFRSGHPKMPRYKRWIETMFTEVQDQLDDERRLKRSRDYRDIK